MENNDFCTLTAAVLPHKKTEKFLGIIPLPKLIVAEKVSAKDINTWGAKRIFEELTGEKPYGDVLITKSAGIKQGSIAPEETG